MRTALSRTLTLAVLMALTATLPAGAQDTHQVVAPDAIKWGPSPPGLPQGAQFAVLSGDPGKRGIYVVRAKMPDGYTIPAHWHRKPENVTVLSGTLNIGTGDKLDKSKADALKAGGFTFMPAKMRHYAWSTGETVIEIAGTGPFDIRYVDKNDDPTKAKPSGQ